VRKSRRFHLGLPSELEADLTAFAHGHGLGLGPAIRLLTAQALAAKGLQLSTATPPSDSPAALAALTASEHAVLMVASVLPEGERRMRSLAERATVAAVERLALFQPAGNRGEERA
jgi:hypothetical protein